MADSSNVSWTNSIQTKIVILMLFTTTLVLGGFAIYSALDSKQKRLAELDTLATSTASRLASHLIYPLWDLDDEQVSQSVVAEMAEQKIFGIIVRDSDKRTIFAAQKRNQNWAPEKFDGLQIGAKNLIHVEQPIVRGDETIGRVEIYMTPKFVDAELTAYYGQIFIQLFVLNLILFVALFFTLRRTVIKPINELAGAAEAMSRGDFDAQISTRSNNEIGRVANAMERMKTSLKMAMSRINAQQPA